MNSKKRKGSKRLEKALRIARLVLFFLQIITAAALIVETMIFAILPGKYVLVMIMGLCFAALLSFLLLTVSKKRRDMIIGCIWALLWILICVLAVVLYLEPARKSLKKVTNKEATETIHVTGISVLVRKDDKAQKLEETNGYVYGIQTSEDYAFSLGAYEYIAKMNGMNITVKEFEYYDNLAQALINKEIDAMIADTSYLEMLNEYSEGFSGNYRILSELDVESEFPKSDISVTPTPTEFEVMPTIDPDNPDITPEPGGEKNPTGAPAKPTPTPIVQKTPMPDRGEFSVTEDYFIVYISGIDCYGTIDARSRSDVNILMVVNPTTGKIQMVTVPRDSYVPLAGFGGGSYDKLTHAGLYGVKTSMNTLDNLFGIKTDYYVRVNFSSVERFVDLLGGVDIYSPIAFTSHDGQNTFTAGWNHVNGKRALSFARERYAFQGGDFQRGKNQMDLIKAVFGKMTSTAALTNFPNLMSQVSNNFQTNMTMDQLTALCRMQLDRGISWSIDTYAVTASGGNAFCYSYKGSKLYVAYLNSDSVKEAASKMRAVMEGR
ncbi:MAG: LCP family protein [Lachnospiraceae bacterium]|nr:LCP family protein [Lachnospiraceae bacterium]